MTGTDNVVKIPLRLEMKKNHTHQAVRTIMRILTFDVASTPQERAFLMELMTKLAQAHDNTPDNQTTFLKVSKEEAIGLWHCCNVVANNPELLESMEMKISTLEILSDLAPKIDLYLKESSSTPQS